MSAPIYLPLAEAARRIGRSTDTLRRWISTGRLRAKRLPDSNGRLYVLAEDLGLNEEEKAQEQPARKKRPRKPRQSREEREAEEFLRREGVI